MEQYISKSVVLAEIKRRIKNLTHEMSKFYYASNYNEWKFAVNEYKSLVSFINTLKIEEVDLEEEIDNELNRTWYGEYLNTDKFKESAVYFFELGLKAQKGE